MFCSNCGNEISENAVACPSCGEPTKNQLKTDSENKTVGGKTIFISYLVALIVPIIGVVVAIYLLFRHRVGHAIGVAVVSFVFMGFWYGALLSGPDAANFSWECGATGASSLQCEISNAGPGTGTVSFDIVAICDDGEHLATVNSGEVGAGGVVQRVVRVTPEVSMHTSCDGFEYRNESIN